MTADHGYSGFPRYTGPEQGWTVYPPKDESWRDQANCVGMPASWFFPEQGERGVYYSQARAVCSGCEVRVECLTYAQTQPIEFWGLWGGLTGQERARLRSPHARRRA